MINLTNLVCLQPSGMLDAIYGQLLCSGQFRSPHEQCRHFSLPTHLLSTSKTGVLLLVLFLLLLLVGTSKGVYNHLLCRARLKDSSATHCKLKNRTKMFKDQKELKANNSTSYKPATENAKNKNNRQTVIRNREPQKRLQIENR